jgi:hypothetical protein
MLESSEIPFFASDMSVYSVDKLIAEARRLAVAYRQTTGRPLAGVSGEICRHDAASLLDLELQQPGAGYDAQGRSGSLAGLRILIKGRAIFDHQKSGQRIGQLRVDQPWDLVLLVLMDEQFEPFEIHAAARDDIAPELEKAVDSPRARRGAMSVARFCAIGSLLWSREDGVLDGGVWRNHAPGRERPG